MRANTTCGIPHLVSLVPSLVSLASVFTHTSVLVFMKIVSYCPGKLLPRKTGIPKLVSLAYYFWLKFVSSSSRAKNSTIDSLISCFGRRSRNRWASDNLLEAQRDRQTRSASSSSARLVFFLLCIVFQERMIQVASTAQPNSSAVRPFVLAPL
jgi:hypothetical protein